jgi:hypothetical protein
MATPTVALKRSFPRQTPTVWDINGNPWEGHLTTVESWPSSSISAPDGTIVALYHFVGRTGTFPTWLTREEAADVDRLVETLTFRRPGSRWTAQAPEGGTR